MTEPLTLLLLDGFVDDTGRPSIEQDGMFDVDPNSLFPLLTPTRVPTAGLSAGRRLTVRQHSAVEAHRHPLAKWGAAYSSEHVAAGRTCGDCAHRVLTHWHNRTYPKCAVGIDHHERPLDEAPRASHGPATDCRAWWPACTDWQHRG